MGLALGFFVFLDGLSRVLFCEDIEKEKLLKRQACFIDGNMF